MWFINLFCILQIEMIINILSYLILSYQYECKITAETLFSTALRIMLLFTRGGHRHLVIG
jgi:hypothetical protein